MSNMILFKRLVPAAVSNPTNGVDVSNALSIDPKEAVVSPGSQTNITVRVDLGVAQNVDSFFIGFLNNILSLTISTGLVTTSMTARGTAALCPSSQATPMRQHAFLRLGAPVSARYIDFASVRGTGDATLGIYAAGLAFQPTWNREWDSGRLPIDTGVVTPLLGGGFGIGEGALKSGYQWTFGDLTDSDVEALYGLVLLSGMTRPGLVIEDPDATSGLNERIHYGLFTNFQRFGRQSFGITRWSLEVQEWV